MRWCLVFVVLIFVSHIPLVNAGLPETPAEIVDHDPNGVWLKSRSFKQVKNLGAQMVYFPEERNFFAYWVPKNYSSGRIMVNIHGTGGNPYEELKDEIPWAEKFDYMVVAVNWYSHNNGFFTARDLYRNILEALVFIQKKTGNDLTKIAYIGFSRGAAISYEIAHLDVTSDKVFDFFIAHSGGIPKDLRVEAKNPNSKPDRFFYRLTQGELGSQAFEGANFFLYSGDQDENWGATMSDQMAYAKELIESGGGRVVEWVRDPNAGHMGFRNNRSINEKAIRYFIELTSN